MVERDEPLPYDRPSPSPDRELTWPEKMKLQEAELVAKAHAEREAVGDRARAALQQENAQIGRRLEREEWERERGY